MKHLKGFNNYLLESVGIEPQELSRIKSEVNKYSEIKSFISVVDAFDDFYKRYGLSGSEVRRGFGDLINLKKKDKDGIYAFLKVIGLKGNIDEELFRFFKEYDDYFENNNDLFQWCYGVLNFVQDQMRDPKLANVVKRQINIDNLVKETSELFTQK